MKNISVIINFLGTTNCGKFSLVIWQLFSNNWYDERPLEQSPGIYGMNLRLLDTYASKIAKICFL